MSSPVLLVEDDENIAALIGKYLTRESMSYRWVKNGAEAIEVFQEIQPMLTILDIKLPRVSGLTLCQKIRALSDVPIIMVTSMTDDEHRLAGFAKGADDYVCKPFNPRELIARIHAVLRRAQKNPTGFLHHEPFRIDLNTREVYYQEALLELTQTEYDLLKLFLNHPTKAFSREELIKEIRTDYWECSERSIDFHIKNLRKKINANTENQWIKNVYGFGYRFT